MSSFGYDVLGFGSSANTAVDLPSDDEFNRVSFLSHFDGANNGVNNVFDDGSASNHTITANGNVTQGSFGPFARPDGEWGVAFDGSGDRVRATFADVIESVAFTIEAWVFIPSDMDQYDCIAWLQEETHGSDGDNGFFIRANNSNTIEFAVLSGGTKYNTISSAISFGEWHHLSLSKSGTTMYSSVDGTVTSRSAPSSINNSKYLNIGAADASGSVSYPFNGLISNVRFLKGTALYTSNFTVPTSPLTVITNTKFLGCQSNRFVDNSSNGYTITTSGNPAVSAFGPFLTTSVYDPAVNAASLFIPQQGSYLSLTAVAAMRNPSSFTLEGWVYLTEAPAGSNATAIFALGNAGQDDLKNSYSVGVRADLKPRVVSAGFKAETIQSNIPIKLNEWAHLALTWDSTTWSLYQNGVRSGTSTTQALSTSDYTQGYVGRDYYSDGRFAPNAYYTDVRMVTGTHVYSGTTYTVPTAPLTAITNTKLLLNMANGQAIDSAAQNNLTLYGNTKISSTQSKFGGTSLYFDGTDDYATFNTITLSGDFTVEAYAYASNIDTEQCLLGELTNTRTQVFRINHIQADSILVFGSESYIFGGTNNLNSALNGINSNTWFHMAVTRQSGVCRLFVNGALKDTNNSDTNSLILNVIGNKGDGTQDWNGYADELRITNGVARYTSAFTAPAEPFADKGQ